MGTLIALLILALAVWLSMLIVDLLKMQEPAVKLARAVIAVFALIALIGILFGFVPVPAHWMRVN